MGWAQGHPFSRPRSRRPGLLRPDPVALHPDVQGLVLDPQEARRLTLVPPRGLKSHADRLPLRLGGGPVGDIPQGGARLPVTSHRTVVTPAILGPVRTVPDERRAANSGQEEARRLWLESQKCGENTLVTRPELRAEDADAHRESRFEEKLAI